MSGKKSETRNVAHDAAHKLLLERYEAVRESLRAAHVLATQLHELIEQQRLAPQGWVYGAMLRKALHLRNTLGTQLERWHDINHPDNDNGGDGHD